MVGDQPQVTVNLDEQLKSFWDLESLGIVNEEKTLYDEFKERISFHDGRYKVPLPWKEFHEPLEDNYSLSVNRLRGFTSMFEAFSRDSEPIIMIPLSRSSS